MRVERIYPAFPQGIDREQGALRRSASTEDGIELDAEANHKRRQQRHNPPEGQDDLPREETPRDLEAPRTNALDIVA